MTQPVPVLIIRCRGIGELPNQTNMCARVTARLTGNHYVIRELNWPAQYGTPLAFNEGIRVWTPRLIAMVRDYPGRVIILGFSAGAKLAGDAVAAMPPEVLAKVIGVGLIADPSQPYLDATDKCGILGARPIDGVPAVWKWHPRDMIPYTNNPILREVGKVSGEFGLGGRIDVAVNVIRRVLAMARANTAEWQKINAPGVLPGALNGVRGYLEVHPRYDGLREGNGRTYTDNLADWVKSLGR